MAVLLTPTSSVPDDRAYLHSEFEIDCIAKDADVGEDCGICMLDCDIPIPQFIDTNDVDNDYSNDWFSFIMKGLTGGSIVASFENLATGATQLITNNDYGTLNDIGDYFESILSWSFTVDWHAVHAAYGYGPYKFTFVRKNGSGNTITTKESPCFFLAPWVCEDAHGTVVIETLHTGVRPLIEGGFNYTGIKPTTYISGLPVSTGNGWKQRIRWYGKFAKTTQETVTDNIPNNQRGLEQVQTQIIDKFTLRLDYIMANISDPIIYDNFLANKIEITDYNVDNPDVLVKRRVILESIEDAEPMEKSKHRQIVTKFADYLQNMIKRNY